jgi:3'(2'), 5'-bisphosphate nucleotidase
MKLDWQNFLLDVIALAKQAGKAVMPLYQQATLTVTQKSDRTPVTEADFIAHHIIVNGLSGLNPQFPVLSEEAADIDYVIRQTWPTYWLVDPLDGTKEFIDHNGEFTVNIALIHNNDPVLGVVYTPVLDICYFAVQNGLAYKQEQEVPPEVIQTQPWSGPAVRVVGSRRHNRERLEHFFQNFPNLQFTPMGSSLKSCTIAQGDADIYLRLGPTSEWDTAAAQCIVEAAGGQIVDVQGHPLRYNTKESLLNPWFLVYGDPKVNWLEKLMPIIGV